MPNVSEQTMAFTQYIHLYPRRTATVRTIETPAIMMYLVSCSTIESINVMQAPKHHIIVTAITVKGGRVIEGVVSVDGSISS